ncbi:Transcriptional regulatory protein moc3 like [Verticillium longisporum]|uniref:Transcriptional regulatory protein moc3 like n=1 Tax=Verticillium longisporum TaxID=100787 RepID=A0A8I2ZEX9_VERLO|nr:Transcriptional regulatory protein moc3 like [Verticillium longisporum]
MVNTGKPSGGCKLCKLRRIKCDEVKPFCMKCKKAKRDCPGYSDPFEAKIRDQTQATIRRFRKMRGDTTGAENRTSPPQAPFTECLQTPFTSHKQTTTMSAMAVLHRRNGSSNSNSSNSSLDSLMSTCSTSSTSSDGDNGRADQYIPLSIINHLEDRATSYFLSEFVLIPMREGNLPVRGYFPWVPKFMSKTQPAKVFLSAFRATSLASIATQHGKTVIGSALSAAQRHYLVAVRAMNQAIQDPTLAKSDETLAAVLLLALYETLVTSSRGSIKEYINHMKGAAMMVKLRGEQGLATQEGEAMFTTTRNHVLGFSCLPCAPEISEFTWLLRHTCAREKDIAALNIANSAIRQDIDRVFRKARDAGHDNRHPRTVQRVLTILQSARALEARYRRLNDTHVPPQWASPVAEWVASRPDADLDTCATAPGPVYGFETMSMGVVHLMTFVSHLMLTTSVLRCAAWLAGPDADWRAGDEYRDMAATAGRRVADLVALAPYFCRWNGRDHTRANFACGAEARAGDPLKRVAGQIVLWPLFAASVSDFAKDGERRFLQGRLRYLADVAGITQARTFLEMRVSSPSDDIERDRGTGYHW